MKLAGTFFLFLKFRNHVWRIVPNDIRNFCFWKHGREIRRIFLFGSNMCQFRIHRKNLVYRMVLFS